MTCLGLGLDGTIGVSGLEAVICGAMRLPLFSRSELYNGPQPLLNPCSSLCGNENYRRSKLWNKMEVHTRIYPLIHPLNFSLYNLIANLTRLLRFVFCIHIKAANSFCPKPHLGQRLWSGSEWSNVTFAERSEDNPKQHSWYTQKKMANRFVQI